MQALHQEILPPSGVEYATSLRLTPSTLGRPGPSTSGGVSVRHEFAAKALCNLVVARSNLLRIFEVRQGAASLSPPEEKARNKAQYAPGEGDEDIQGHGSDNIAQENSNDAGRTVTKVLFVREHRLHGIVTGLESVKIISSLEDKLDRLLISFKDAKIALLEWSDAVHDLVTVSIHTYERAPQLMSLDSPLFQSYLRVDPLSRCTALSLPKEAIAVLPFYQTQEELDVMDQDVQSRDIPYAPSFILDLPASVNKDIRNVIDFAFLPGFNNPTIALLYQTQLTWTGRLKEYKDTAKLVMFTLDVITQSYPIIYSIDGLPYDSFGLVACDAAIGGVVVLTANALVYVDQAGNKRVSLAVNGWAARISDLPYTYPEDKTTNLTLEGSRCLFVDEKTFYIVLKDGSVHSVEAIVEGKNVAKLSLGPLAGQTTPPNALSRVSGDVIFVGSTAGPSVLLQSAKVEEELEQEDVEMDDVSAPAAAFVSSLNNEMDFDDDEDIYGTSTQQAPAQANGTTATNKKTRTVTKLSLCDALPAYGAIADMSFSLAINGDRPVAELVAATGFGPTGGFTVFQRDLPIRTKRKLHAIGGTRGLWSFSVRQSVKAGSSGSVSSERAGKPHESENDTLLISTDAIPTPGLSRLVTRSSTKNDIQITSRIPGTTIAASPFFQRTAIVHIMTNALRVLEPDGTERQLIKDMDNNTPRPKIRFSSILDPFVLIIREDDSIGLFIDAGSKGKIRRKDMSPMGDKASRYLAGSFFEDTTGMVDACLRPQPATSVTTNGDTNATTQQAAVSAKGAARWLLLIRPQGILEIWTLPKLTLAFSTQLVGENMGLLRPVMEDSFEGPANSASQDATRDRLESDVESVLVAPLGESDPQPHLFLFFRSGEVAIYQVTPGSQPFDPATTTTRTPALGIKFVKVLTKAFELKQPDESDKSILAEQKKVLRQFVPFTATFSPTKKSFTATKRFTGVFFTGENPRWILSTDKSPVHMYPSGHSLVHSFTPCSMWESGSEFLIYSEEGPSLLEWIPDFDIHGPLPSKWIPRGRSYSKLIFDHSTSLIVAAASLNARFASFDDDGNVLWEPDAPNISEPTAECSTLELISPDVWVTMDGFEFATNEFVNDIACIPLETASTDAGMKDFIVVGTTINRGEDLAVKGCTYIFEIVEVVPHPQSTIKRWYKLRLRCKDEAKGPVTAVCGFNGYVVSSMGQKIFVRAFDADERLVGVAFMDVGVYVTSLKTLKNLLLVGDAVKSLWFVAFQEDPYKLVLLSKDARRHIHVSDCNFFFTGDQLSFLTCDDDGIMRTYNYDPTDPDSADGRQLLIQSEFNTQVEYQSSILTAQRSRDGEEIPQSELLFGAVDGSLSSLIPVDNEVAKRFGLLQGQLTRNMQHFAGLNPRAHRIVRNDYESKSLSRGVLDGNLLAQFEELPVPRQVEMTRQIGTERDVILKDWSALNRPW